MKLFFGFAIFIWLLCGLVGSWMKDDLDSDHLVMIAKGPITLVKAVRDAPTPYPSSV
ncbi:MAG TPA: hypothetical protein VNB78_09320 [Sphingomicrobium sp.]|jgi:hypothetical protein|nr:hypothetical protein [Sphingomicrobium sp.]